MTAACTVASMFGVGEGVEATSIAGAVVGGVFAQAPATASSASSEHHLKRSNIGTLICGRPSNARGTGIMGTIIVH